MFLRRGEVVCYGEGEILGWEAGRDGQEGSRLEDI